MAAGKATLNMEQGSTFSTSLTITDANNVAVDLTSHTVDGKMRKSFYSTIGVQDLTVVIDAPGTDGNITISLTAAETSALDASSRYVFDINITLSGVVSRVLEGIVTVAPTANF